MAGGKHLNRSTTGRWAIALASILLTAACDPGSDEPGALFPPSADLTGAWTVSETLYGNCPGVIYPEIRNYTATIAQAGNSLSIVDDSTGATYQGTISGAAVNWGFTTTDVDGTTSGTFPGTVSEDGNALGGTATWSWTNAAHTSSCSGTSRVAASRGGMALAAPTGVAAVAGYSQATLSWTPSIGATRYNIRQATTPGGAATGTLTMITYAPSTTTTLRRLTNGTTHYFAMTAVNAAGVESPASVEVSATPLSSYPRPATPTNVVATAGAGRVTVSCDPVAGATKYLVYQATAAGQMTTYAALGGHTSYLSSSCTAINIFLVTPGTTYYFVVTAWNVDGESEPSAEVTATPY